jgi:hypothetical protein
VRNPYQIAIDTLDAAIDAARNSSLNVEDQALRARRHAELSVLERLRASIFENVARRAGERPQSALRGGEQLR